MVEAVRDSDDVPGVRAAFDVAADPDDLLQLLWDVSKFKQIFPDIKELIVEGRPDENTVVVRFVVDAAVAQVSYTLRRVVDRTARTVSWVSVAGDLKKIVGFWRVKKNADGGSHVVYQSVVDVGFVPGATSVYRSLVMSKMGAVVDHVRSAAQQLPPRPVAAPSSSTE